MKRYAIVRVDYWCPSAFEEGTTCKKQMLDDDCFNGKCPYRYGDTKEQLVKKIAQVLKRKADLSNYNKEGAKFCYNLHFKYCEDLAKEIVEFLGVEE